MPKQTKNSSFSVASSSNNNLDVEKKKKRKVGGEKASSKDQRMTGLPPAEELLNKKKNVPPTIPSDDEELDPNYEESDDSSVSDQMDDNMQQIVDAPLVEIEQEAKEKKKRKQSKRRFRKCLYCGEPTKYLYSHFMDRNDHGPELYKKFAPLMRLKKGQKLPEELEPTTALHIGPKSSEVDESLPVKQRMDNHGMYDKCSRDRCPFLDEYQSYLLKLRGVNTDQTAVQYVNKISAIIQQCCDRSVPVLSLLHLAQGFAKNIDKYLEVVYDIAKSPGMITSYCTALIGFIGWVKSRNDPFDEHYSRIDSTFTSILNKLAIIQKCYLRKSKLETQAAAIENPRPPLMSYRECLAFIRSREMQQKFHDIICDPLPIIKPNYNFVLFYVITRILFRNAARPEVAYKSELKFVKSTNFRGSLFTMLKIPNAKCKLTMHALTEEDASYYNQYQDYRSCLLQQLDIPDQSGMCFVNFDMKPLTAHISTRAKVVMRRNGFPELNFYDVRRSSVTASRQKFFDDIGNLEAGQYEIGQNTRGHNAKTSLSHYDESYEFEKTIKSFQHLRMVEEDGEMPLAEIPEKLKDDFLSDALNDTVLPQSDSESDTNDEPRKSIDPIDLRKNEIERDSQFFETIRLRQQSRPIENLLDHLCPPLEEGEDPWTPEKDYKVVIRGTRTRNYTNAWKRAIENELKERSGFMRLGFTWESVDKFIPSEVFKALANEKAKLSLRRLIFSNISSHLGKIQTIGIIRFLSPDLIDEKMTDDQLLEVVKKTAAFLQMQWCSIKASEIKHLKMIAAAKDIAGEKVEEIRHQTNAESDKIEMVNPIIDEEELGPPIQINCDSPAKKDGKIVDGNTTSVPQNKDEQNQVKEHSLLPTCSHDAVPRTKKEKRKERRRKRREMRLLKKQSEEPLDSTNPVVEATEAAENKLNTSTPQKVLLLAHAEAPKESPIVGAHSPSPSLSSSSEDEPQPPRFKRRIFGSKVPSKEECRQIASIVTMEQEQVRLAKENDGKWITKKIFSQQQEMLKKKLDNLKK